MGRYELDDSGGPAKIHWALPRHLSAVSQTVTARSRAGTTSVLAPGAPESETLGPRGIRLATNSRQLPTVFAVLAFVVGTFLVFAQPPGQGLDETVHFDRVWTLSQGDVVVAVHRGEPGGAIPQCVSQYLSRFSSEASRKSPFAFSGYWRQPTDCSRAPFTSVGTASANSPISYAFSLVAVVVLRSVGASLPVVFFGGRLATLLGFIAIFYLAMRLTPVGKQVLFVLGLLPTTLLLASSFSADPMTISLAALSVALTLRCRLSPEASWTTALGLLATLVALCLTKPTLFIFAPLILMVPSTILDRFPRPRLLRWTGFGLVLGCAGLWYLVVRHDVGAPFPLYGLNAPVQSRSIVDHPVGYLKVLARTFFEGTGENRWIPGFFFSIGYYRTDNVYAPVGIVIVGTLVLAYAFQLQWGAKRIVEQGTRLLALLPIALIAIGVLIIETSLYVYGTPLGLPYTQAEGRYFIPLTMLGLVTAGILREPRLRPRSTRWILLGVLIMLVWLILKVFVHDYSL